MNTRFQYLDHEQLAAYCEKFQSERRQCIQLLSTVDIGMLDQSLTDRVKEVVDLLREKKNNDLLPELHRDILKRFYKISLEPRLWQFTLVVCHSEPPDTMAYWRYELPGGLWAAYSVNPFTPSIETFWHFREINNLVVEKMAYQFMVNVDGGFDFSMMVGEMTARKVQAALTAKAFERWRDYARKPQ